MNILDWNVPVRIEMEMRAARHWPTVVQVAGGPTAGQWLPRAQGGQKQTSLN